MRYRRPRPSIVLAAVTAVVVASPVAVLVGGSAPDNAVDQRTPASDAISTTIRQVSLDTVPSTVLDLVRSGLAGVGVTLPPLDLLKLQIPDIARALPPGVLPTGLIPPELLPSTAPSTTSAAATTDPRKPVSAPVPAGAVVKEITRKDPFSMIALTWDGLSDTTAYVRARQPDGSWGKWYSADPVDGGPAVRTGRTPTSQGTEPVWVGNTKAVQVVVTKDGVATPGVEGAKPAPSAGATATTTVPEMSVAPGEIAPRAFTVPRAPVQGDPMAPAATPAPPGPTTTASVPAPMTTPSTPNALEKVVSTLKAALIDPGTGGAPGGLGLPAVLPGQQPPIITRAQWGADESKRCQQPTYDPGLKAAVVHHTAGNNDYTAEQSAEIVRGIYAYHAQTLGWCDIGYNALVDKYGQIFEGAFGGLDKNVQGTHTGGFNRDTVGVAMIGNYNDVAPSPETIRSVGSFLGWRLKLAGLDPKANAQLTSIGFDTAKFGAGETSNLPVISGHRDYDNTECPGTLGYAALPQIRDVAAGNLAAAGSPSAAPTAPGTSTTPGAPSTSPGAADVLSTTDVGAIAKKWLSLGGATGPLGQAQTPEMTTPDGAAKYVNFSDGKIYWSKETGAQVVQGAIEKAWGAAGFEKSALGMPVSGETDAVSGIITQAFQFGSLVFNKTTGVVVKVIKAFVDEFTRSMRDQLSPAARPATPPAASTPAPAGAPVPVPTTGPVG
ncbi:N-acetylmuramoyl-L-alanine amidase [Williamsia sp.]|uniref:N-acetylmuramoyl-L-alanine amidase n=1 Tax=Williamsia sp. TaxID=1872085 RepID=UPI0025F3F950|nr:N-acetylmuramoyl-L-alanine amidase [Williamsia sp.]